MDYACIAAELGIVLPAFHCAFPPFTERGVWYPPHVHYAISFVLLLLFCTVIWSYIHSHYGCSISLGYVYTTLLLIGKQQMCPLGPSPVHSLLSLHVLSTPIKSPHTHAPVVIPTQYQFLTEIFSTTRVAHLLLHRRWNCVIDLLPGTTPPQAHVYQLSLN